MSVLSSEISLKVTEKKSLLREDLLKILDTNESALQRVSLLKEELGKIVDFFESANQNLPNLLADSGRIEQIDFFQRMKMNYLNTTIF